MAARIDAARFYADEPVLGLGKSLAYARHDVLYCGHPLIPECNLGIQDADWIPLVANRGLVAITRDKHIRTRPVERMAVKQSGLRMFAINTKTDMDTWGWLTLLVRHWSAIEDVMTQQPRGPWVYTVNLSGLSAMSLDD